MEIKCPLTNSTDVRLIKTIKTSFIINLLKESNIDVSRFFKNLNEVYVYKCVDSDYKFYFPFNLEGDNQFYKDLQKFHWYYMDWKWEYDEAYKIVKRGDKVLEIGCGKGDFIEKLKDDGIDSTGLEFNEEAINKCKEKNLKIYKETIDEHALYNKERYDVVCSFEVMEHIAKIRKALQSSINALKIGGKLIISVPNNDSFIRKEDKNSMNMPPHHMGLWNEKSLRYLEKILNLKIEKISFEPLQSYHYRFYYNAMFGNKINKIFGPLGKYINIILGRVSLYLMVHTDLPKRIKGHTIMAIYKKI